MQSTLSTFFNNTNTLILSVYEGLVLIIGGVLLIKFLITAIPAMLDARKKESAEFKSRITDIILAVAVYLAAALAPVWLPLLVTFFGGVADFASSISGVN